MPNARTSDISRRDVNFDLTSINLDDWHPAGRHVSHFFNIQSLFFPQGERFFIRSVRHFRGELEDAVLEKQVGGFIGQEATHSQEHEVYNAKLDELGYPAKKADRFLKKAFALMERLMSPKTLLAMTLAFEHLTAIAAEDMLGKNEVFEGADAEMVRLWRWHSLEETEHKAVAYDVYQQVAGSGLVSWFRRCTALLTVGLGMQLAIWYGMLWVMYRTGGLFDLSGWGRLFRFLWWRPGIYTHAMPRYFQYLRPGFHPWDIETHHLVERWEREYPRD